MKKSEFEKFQDFKKRYKITNKQIANILTDYATTADEYSASFFSEKYNISKHVFYKMRDYCLVFMLVDANICKQIRDKAFRNQGNKNQSGNYSSAYQHYMNLLQKRKEYLMSFSPQKLIRIAKDYSNGYTLDDIAKHHGISRYTVRKLLAIALMNHLVSEHVFLKIKDRSNRHISRLNNYSGPSAEDLWNYHFH